MLSIWSSPENLLFGKELTLYHMIQTCNDLGQEDFWKTLWEKGKMLVISSFSFSHNVFYPINYKLCYVIYIYNVIG